MLEAIRSLLGPNWLRLSWGVYGLLTNPYKVTLGLLLLLGFILLCTSARLRRQLAKTLLVALLVYWIIISPIFATLSTQLLVSFVPQYQGQSADAVVVLARQKKLEGDRYSTASFLFEKGQVSQILAMGRDQSMRIFKLLQQRNLDIDNRLWGLGCARTTVHEAYLTASVLGRQGIEDIILITDSPHMLRSWLTFRGMGFKVIPYIEPLPSDLSSPIRSSLAIREYFGLVSYALLGRFRSQPLPLAQLAQEAAEKFPSEYCTISTDAIRALASQG